MRFVQSLLPFFFLLFLVGCGGEDELPVDTLGIVDPNFELDGQWFFKTVSGEGTISGVETKDDDPNPTGYIIFRDDLTGYSEFSINLLDRPYGKTENFTWERVSERALEIDKGDGDIETWTIVRANENVVEAKWEIFFSDQFNAVITSVFTPEP